MHVCSLTGIAAALFRRKQSIDHVLRFDETRYDGQSASLMILYSAFGNPISRQSFFHRGC